MGKSDSKLDLAESCEEDYEKQKFREEIQILKASLENQSPEVVQVKKSQFFWFFIFATVCDSSYPTPRSTRFIIPIPIYHRQFSSSGRQVN